MKSLEVPSDVSPFFRATNHSEKPHKSYNTISTLEITLLKGARLQRVP